MTALVIVILAIIVILALLASMASSAASANQAQAAIEAARAAQIASAGQAAATVQVTVLVALLVLVAAGAVAVIVYLLARQRKLEALVVELTAKQPGGWVSGPNANWGRVGQPRQPQLDPAQVMMLALLERLTANQTPAPPQLPDPNRQDFWRQ